MGRISPGPTSWPPGAKRRLVLAKTNLKPQTSMCAPPHGWARRPGAWPASWLSVLPCCLAPLMQGRAVLVCRPPHGGACGVGARPPRWCVVWWCWAWVVVCAALRPASLGSGWWCFGRRHAQLVLLIPRRLRLLTVCVFGWLWSAVGLRLGLCCLLGRGWCSACAWPPSWWGLLRWCVAPPW